MEIGKLKNCLQSMVVPNLKSNVDRLLLQILVKSDIDKLQQPLFLMTVHYH